MAYRTGPPILDYLTGAVADSPVLIIGSVRDEEHPARPLSLLIAHPAARLTRLPPLDEAAITALAEHRATAPCPTHYAA